MGVRGPCVGTVSGVSIESMGVEAGMCVQREE